MTFDQKYVSETLMETEFVKIFLQIRNNNQSIHANESVISNPVRTSNRYF